MAHDPIPDKPNGDPRISGAEMLDRHRRIRDSLPTAEEVARGMAAFAKTLRDYRATQ